MPQGLPSAAERAAKDIEKHLLALPKGASFQERFAYAQRKVWEESSEGRCRWSGALVDRTPDMVAINLKTNTEQSSVYDEDFLGGRAGHTNAATYTILPVNLL